MRFLAIIAFAISATHSDCRADDRPNILWFVIDDMSANFSCYGETTIRTPAVDELARRGTRFTRAYATSPVCSTFRSALITGMYQTSIGSHHHRSGRGKHRIQLPESVRPVPVYFQKAGYWTCNGSGLRDYDFRTQRKKPRSLGKTDYNFEWNREIYDSNDWAGREAGQPFFMQVQLHGGKLRGASEASTASMVDRAIRELGTATQPSDVELPPYYPRDTILLKDWSTYLDTVRITDVHVGRVVDRLKNEGLLENTLIVFFTDHGISHARGKQFLYDEGAHIPLIVAGPGVESELTREDLVEHIDIAALSLVAAGIPVPESMQGRDIMASGYQPRNAVYAARDRCGEAADRIRSVRTDRFLYIRNFYPQRPLLQPSQYKDSKLILLRLRELHAEGTLPALSEKILFAESRPREELYEYQNDRWQVRNLAGNDDYSIPLAEHRRLLDRWIEQSGDMGPETPEVYALEMKDQLSSTKPASERYQTLLENIKLYQQWAEQGK